MSGFGLLKAKLKWMFFSWGITQAIDILVKFCIHLSPSDLLITCAVLNPPGARRGYARHRLVPKGLAAFGTWENIDVQNSARWSKKTIHQQGGRGNGVLEHWVRKTLNIYELSEVQMYFFLKSSKLIPCLGVTVNRIFKSFFNVHRPGWNLFGPDPNRKSEAYADPQLIEDPTMKAREKPSPSTDLSRWVADPFEAKDGDDFFWFPQSTLGGYLEQQKNWKNPCEFSDELKVLLIFGAISGFFASIFFVVAVSSWIDTATRRHWIDPWLWVTISGLKASNRFFFGFWAKTSWVVFLKHASSTYFDPVCFSTNSSNW